MQKNGSASCCRQDRPLIEQISAWIEERDAADQLVSEWQDLEHKLSLRARSMRLDFERVLASRLPESRKLRALSKQITADDKRLSEAVRLIVDQASVSAHDALAKIKLALRLAQVPYGDEISWALVAGGLYDLEAIFEQT